MHAWIDTILELLVVLILLVEFWYDWRLNQHVKSLKKRTKRNFDFQNLTDGEGR
jgi:hypothetical protein